MMLLLLTGGVLLVGAVRNASRPIDSTPVATFDLNRFMGRWYEIARFDHRFERGLQQVETLYTLRPDGKVEVLNSGIDTDTGARREARGKAYATAIPGRLRVSFFWIFYSDYNVLALDSNYHWALVGSKSAKYLWILSRTPTLPDKTLQYLLPAARDRGYDTSELLFTVR